MRRSDNSRVSVLELCSLLEDLLERSDLPSEAEYRIHKLISRTIPITSMMFLKTVKGQELILECMELTRSLDEQLVSGRRDLYQEMTRLENVHDELLRKTFQFRVKAG